MEARRSYTLRDRARSQEATRRRIVEAAAALHEEVGPRATTISAIAERAGVQRLTVYRHFPDEGAIFEACTGHWLAENPPPGPEAWASGGPKQRRAAALVAFYGYYRRTRAMWAASHRDVAAVPALQGPMRSFRDGIDAIAAALSPDLGRSAQATLRHALAFPTWEELEAQGLSDAAKAGLAVAWIAGASAVEGAN
jgi:AcrR family transcriptional regulator